MNLSITLPRLRRTYLDPVGPTSAPVPSERGRGYEALGSAHGRGVLRDVSDTYLGFDSAHEHTRRSSQGTNKCMYTSGRPPTGTQTVGRVYVRATRRGQTRRLRRPPPLSESSV